MIKKLVNYFRSTFYVQIWEKRIRVTEIESGIVFNEIPQVLMTKENSKVSAFGNSALVTDEQSELINPFSHPRSLLSNFMMGEKLLQQIFKKLTAHRFIKVSPQVVIHPMEKLEGGLTQIEIRAFKELALGAGAKDVAVYVGKALPLHDFNFEIIQNNALSDDLKNN